MGEPVFTQALSGWGRYPVEECHVYRPEKRRDLEALWAEREQERYIARGMGRSYGDTAVNGGGGVVDVLRLDRMLEFNEENGVLRCEGGVRFDTIIDVFLPRGFFIPVTPGTKFITVGGAIANDVHGKNHHRDGSFGNALIDFELLVPSGEILECSREKNADVFWATVGGVGLTGFIVTARFRLERMETPYVVVDYLKAPDLDAVLSAIAESDENYQYSMAWVDVLASGRNLGRSILMRGNKARIYDVPNRLRGRYDVARKIQPTVLFDFPQFVLNPLSVRAFNTLYYALGPGGEGKLVDYNRYFFPLDFIHDWNRLYGKRGFVQYQVTVPLGEPEGLVEILQTAARSGRASFLAVLKKFGPGNDGLLSHPFEGYTLTLDFAVTEGLTGFMHELDRITLDHGGRLYLAKDVAMTPETFRASYPRLEAFQAVRERLDPGGMLGSNLSRRLAITKGGA